MGVPAAASAGGTAADAASAAIVPWMQSLRLMWAISDHLIRQNTMLFRLIARGNSLAVNGGSRQWKRVDSA
jgi:hypothetical protein